MTAYEGLHCESDLHKTERAIFVLLPIYVRKGAANHWVPENWCFECLGEEARRRSAESTARLK